MPSEHEDRRRHSLAERRARYRRGHTSEWLAAAVLMAKGYRILARRYRTHGGEIDLVAVRGQRLAFVEVKRRRTRAEAEAAIEEVQSRRLGVAVDHWLARHAGYREHEIGLDAVLVLPWRWPIHIENALAP
ncbi:MAG TPA: YraN family protein [Hyphomicrobiaceae bacterium]|nr:YraN family protein [Hyphomicrobiaceae bacterium]